MLSIILGLHLKAELLEVELLPLVGSGTWSPTSFWHNFQASELYLQQRARRSLWVYDGNLISTGFKLFHMTSWHPCPNSDLFLINGMNNFQNILAQSIRIFDFLLPLPLALFGKTVENFFTSSLCLIYFATQRWLVDVLVWFFFLGITVNTFNPSCFMTIIHSHFCVKTFWILLSITNSLPVFISFLLLVSSNDIIVWTCFLILCCYSHTPSLLWLQ